MAVAEAVGRKRLAMVDPHVHAFLQSGCDHGQATVKRLETAMRGGEEHRQRCRAEQK